VKGLALVIVGCVALASGGGAAHDEPKPVSLIQLIANPTEFDRASVRVFGFLAMAGHHGGLAATVLYLHREDADNLLGNSVLVVPSRQMQREEEKINRMYVMLTGTFHATRAANGGYIPEISDVRSCSPWSDPSHPVGLKQDGMKYR
jgi:hypothetical protein